MNEKEIDLKRKDLITLELVSENNGTTARDIVESTEWADTTDIARYRFDRLEERGLVESEYDDEATASNQMAQRVVRPTEPGREIAQEYEDDKDSMTLEQRVERVERQLAVQRDTYGEVKKRIVELENTVDDLDDDLDTASEERRRMKKIIKELKEAVD